MSLPLSLWYQLSNRRALANDRWELKNKGYIRHNTHTALVLPYRKQSAPTQTNNIYVNATLHINAGTLSTNATNYGIIILCNLPLMVPKSMKKMFNMLAAEKNIFPVWCILRKSICSKRYQPDNILYLVNKVAQRSDVFSQDFRLLFAVVCS